jgi:hypothetical protein
MEVFKLPCPIHLLKLIIKLLYVLNYIYSLALNEDKSVAFLFALDEEHIREDKLVG